jgi:hypothetical protein
VWEDGGGNPASYPIKVAVSNRNPNTKGSLPMDREPISDQSLIGVLAAIQILQEVLISKGLTTAKELADQYNARADAYFPALPEAVSFLETLQVSLTDGRHRPIEALHHRKPEGSA